MTASTMSPTPATGLEAPGPAPRGRDGRPQPPRFPACATIVAGLFVLGAARLFAAETVRLDADEAVRRALDVSNLVVSAAARAEARRAGIAAAGAAALPTIAATASVTERSSVPEFAASINGPLLPPVVIYPDIRTAYAGGLRAEQALYTGGAVAAGRSAAHSELTASQAAQAQTVADLRLAARAAYWDAVRSQASLLAATAAEARAKRLAEDTRALLDAGMAVRADVLAARARLASAEVQRIRAHGADDEALAQLRSLLHLAPTDTIELGDTITGPLPPGDADLAELTSRSLHARPELAGLDAQLAVTSARETLALSAARPSLAMAAQWDLARPNQRYFPQADAWRDTWAVGLAASWTLFDGGRARAEAAGVRATRQALAAERDELVRRVTLEVENAHRDLASALAAVGAADAARAAATEREQAARERYDAGLAAMAEILDAEADLALAEQQQIDTRAAAWLAAARLARAVGR